MRQRTSNVAKPAYLYQGAGFSHSKQDIQGRGHGYSPPLYVEVDKANLLDAPKFRLCRLASFSFALQPGDSIGYSFCCLSLSFALLQVPGELVVADYVPDPVAEIAPGLIRVMAERLVTHFSESRCEF